MSAPQFRGIRGEERFPGTAPARRQSGAGRVVYIPEVKPAIEKPLGARMTYQYWKLPLNWREIVDSVRWAYGCDPQFREGRREAICKQIASARRS